MPPFATVAAMKPPPAPEGTRRFRRKRFADSGPWLSTAAIEVNPVWNGARHVSSPARVKSDLRPEPIASSQRVACSRGKHRSGDEGGMSSRY